MKIKIENKTIEEVEIQLPLYRKNLSSFFKIYSETGCIWVSPRYRPLIQDAHVELGWNNKDNIDCTEEEFNEAYEQALKNINNLLNS